MIALVSARAAWAYDVSEPIVFRFDSLNPCDPHRVHQVAVQQDFDTVTTMTFEDTDEPPTVTHQITHVIRLNENCDWSKLNLAGIIDHEYGHILMGPYHSEDKRSIMYPIVGDRGQTILPADREVFRSKIREHDGTGGQQ